MEKRLIMAVALSILIIVTFQNFAPKPPATRVPLPVLVEKAKSISSEELVPPTAKTEQTSEEKTSIIETGKYILTFSNIGGSLKKIQLKDFKDIQSNEQVVLIDLLDPKEY